MTATHSQTFNIKSIYQGLIANILKHPDDGRLIYFDSAEGYFVKDGPGDHNRSFIDEKDLLADLSQGKKAVPHPFPFSDVERCADLYIAATYYEQHPN